MQATKRLRWLSWVAAVALLVGLYLWLGVGEILSVLATLRSTGLLLALGAFILGQVVRVVKWHFPLGGQYDWPELVRLFLMSKVGGALLPGRIGEMVPVVEDKFRSTAVVAWLAVDRVMEGYVTLVFGAFGLVFLGVGDSRILTLWIGMFLLLLALLFLMLHRPLWACLEARTRRWKRISRLFALARRTSEDILRFRRHVLPVIGLTVLGTYLDLWFIRGLFLSTGEEVAMSVIAASHCLGALVAFVSITPGGLGIVELTSVYIYNLYGIPEVRTGVVMLLGRGMPLLQILGLAAMAVFARSSGKTQMAEEPRLKICLAASDGGHLTDLLQLGREACRKHQVFYLTHRSKTTESLPDAYLVEKIGLNVWRMFVATLITLRAFWYERPDVVVSTGAEIALPAFYLGKFLFGARLVYVECSGAATHPTRTGRLVYPVADLFLVQWEPLLRHYGSRARYAGGLI